MIVHCFAVDACPALSRASSTLASAHACAPGRVLSTSKATTFVIKHVVMIILIVSWPTRQRKCTAVHVEAVVRWLTLPSRHRCVRATATRRDVHVICCIDARFGQVGHEVTRLMHATAAQRAQAVQLFPLVPCASFGGMPMTPALTTGQNGFLLLLQHCDLCHGACLK
jgi:hypothetical protein